MAKYFPMQLRKSQQADPRSVNLQTRHGLKQEAECPSAWQRCRILLQFVLILSWLVFSFTVSSEVSPPAGVAAPETFAMPGLRDEWPLPEPEVLMQRKWQLGLIEADTEWLDRQMLPAHFETLTCSNVIHLLYLHGVDLRFLGDHHESDFYLLDSLLNGSIARVVFGQEVLVPTRFGIRPRSRGLRDVDSPQAYESHRDQLLACLAQCSIPLSRPVVVRDEFFAVRDILADSVANFHLGQEELVWTALAYSMYMPPARAWKNRYAETFTFDDLADALMAKPLPGQSCGGAHVLEALAQMHRIDEYHQLFSARVRSKISGYLSDAARLTVLRQSNDGSFPPDWNGWSTDNRLWSEEDTVGARLVATSHLIEWMCRLPKDARVPDAVLRAAATWMLEKVEGGTPDTYAEEFCGYTHTLRVLKLLAR